MKDPVQCPTKGHTFCRHCITKHLDRVENCPICRDPLKEIQLLPNRLICNLIEDEEVKCFSKFSQEEEEEDDGYCDWKGKLSDAESHYEKECQSAKINCSHIGCEFKVRRKFLPSHIKDCLHRLLLCRYCNQRKKIDSLDAHLLVCPQRPATCPNSCLHRDGTIMCFRPHEIPQHLTLCTLESVGCKFSVAGCQIKLLRKDMPLHENDTGAHIGCLLDALQTANAKIDKLDKIIGKMATDYDKNTMLVFKIHISQLENDIKSMTIIINGHRFGLLLRPNANYLSPVRWHSLFLQLVDDTDRIGSVNAKAEIELVSYSEFGFSPAFKRTIQNTNLYTDGYGILEFIQTTNLKHGVYVNNGYITLKAKITVSTLDFCSQIRVL